MPDVRRDSDCWTKLSVSALPASNMRKQKIEHKDDIHTFSGSGAPIRRISILAQSTLYPTLSLVPHRRGVKSYGTSPDSGWKECRTRTFVKSLYVVSRHGECFKAS